MNTDRIKLIGQWVGANALAWALSWGLVGSAMFNPDLSMYDPIASLLIAVLATPLAGGLLQALILRRYLPIPIHHWIWATIWGCLGGAGLGSSVFSLFWPYQVWSFGFMPLIGLAIGWGVGQGLAQWLILRRRLRQVHLWIGISLVAVLVGIALSTLIMIGLSLQGGGFGAVLIAGGTGGGSFGLISGLGVVWLLRQPAQDPSLQADASDPTHPQSPKARIIHALLSGTFAVLLITWFMVIPPSAEFFSVRLLIVGIVYYYLDIAVHELGHWFVARSLGFGFNFMTIGPLQIIRRGDRCRVQLNTSLMVGGGLTSALPLQTAGLRWRMLAMIAGGPLASIGLVVIGSSLLLIPTTVSANPLLWAILCCSILSWLTVIGSLTPYQTHAFHTDGSRFLMVWRNQAAGQRFTSMFALAGFSLAGIRPRHWDPVWIERVLRIPDESMDHASGLLYGYLYALDRGEIQQASRVFDQILELQTKMPAKFRDRLLLETAYFMAFHRQEAESAQALLDQAKERFMIETYTEKRVEAAIAWAKGWHQQAQIFAQEGLTLIQPDLKFGIPQAEADWLKAIVTCPDRT